MIQFDTNYLISIIIFLGFFIIILAFLLLILIFKRKASRKKHSAVILYFNDGSEVQIQPGSKNYLTFIALADHMFSGPENKDMLSQRVIRRYHQEYDDIFLQQEKRLKE